MSRNSIVTDEYEVPSSWDGLDGEYSENGDYAGWVDAIRAALWERVNVCLDGVYRGSNLRTFVTSLGYFEKTPVSMAARIPHGYRGDCEVYEFAKNTELILDYLLTPYREYGTMDNDWGPQSERGYFVSQDPNYWFKTVTYASATQGIKSETTCYVKFLNMEMMFEDSTRNYKLALNGVGKGDTPDKFVPFFNAVKNTLNYMTVIPVTVRGVRRQISPFGFYDEDISVVEGDMTQWYNDAMQGQPDPDYLYNLGFGYNASLENSCRIQNSADEDDTDEDYGGHFSWGHEYPYQVNMKLPPITFNLYRGYWACIPSYWEDEEYGYDSVEFCFGSQYSPSYQLVGQVSGYGHYLGGDNGRHFGSKFPNDSLQFPTTPGRGEYNIKGYQLYVSHFADFNVQGGFNFRGN